MDKFLKKSSDSTNTNPSKLKNQKHITFTPIGIIHSPFKELNGIPRQSELGKGIEGVVEIYQEYALGLKRIEKFEYLTLVYHLHKSKKYELRFRRRDEQEERGVFSTRSPHRPNSIGISVVRLMRIENTKIYIQDLDILDGTPLLDIKPYKKKQIK
jgi:tRNA-Thr(GGU) m(6)t(6)A37 methyltransferase TsaA